MGCGVSAPGRLLLDDPDPVAPLIAELSTALRTALGDAADNVRSAHESETAQLSASDGWQQLDEDQQQAVLQSAGLVPPAIPDLSSTERLLAALSAQPLVSFEERVQSLPAKAVAARKAIAEIVDPEPTVATVKLASATLKSEADVDTYLAALREQLMQHIAAGETVIT
jgi:hypothetical protein